MLIPVLKVTVSNIMEFSYQRPQSSSSIHLHPLHSFLTETPSTDTSLLQNSKPTSPFKASLNICSSLHSSESELPPKVQTFWKWLSEEGVISAKTPVKSGIVPEGLGLIALQDIDRNDVLVKVPKGLWINPDTVAKSLI